MHRPKLGPQSVARDFSASLIIQDEADKVGKARGGVLILSRIEVRLISARDMSNDCGHQLVSGFEVILQGAELHADFAGEVRASISSHSPDQRSVQSRRGEFGFFVHSRFAPVDRLPSKVQHVTMTCKVQEHCLEQKDYATRSVKWLGARHGCCADWVSCRQLGASAIGCWSEDYGRAIRERLSTHFDGHAGQPSGSFEVAHALAWQGEKPATYQTVDEHYDLVVVGAGMSGLAAAWYYQKQQGADVKILLLDNHDDFGGHAKRNEFHHQGKMVLSTGGAVQVDTLSGYSEMATQLMADLGIDEDMIEAMQRQTPTDYLLGGQMQADVGLSIKREGEHEHVTIGGHWLKFFHGRGDYVSAVEALPIPEDQQAKLIAFFGGDEDYLDDLSLLDKWEYINDTRYNHF